MYHQHFINLRDEVTKLSTEVEQKAVKGKNGAASKLIDIYFKLNEAQKHLGQSNGPPAYRFLDQVNECGIDWIMDACRKIMTTMVSLSMHKYDPTVRTYGRAR